MVCVITGGLEIVQGLSCHYLSLYIIHKSVYVCMHVCVRMCMCLYVFFCL